jgi:tetratricopeptide (TPR) repeat protein
MLNNYMEQHTNQWQAREAELKGGRQLAALAEIAADFENIRTAWQWALKRRNDAALNGMIDPLFLFCSMRNQWQEGQAFFRQARQQLAPAPGTEPQPIWGRVLARYPEPGEEKQQLEQSLEIARDHDNKAEAAFCLFQLGREDPELVEGIPLFEKSLTLYRSLGDRFYIGRTHSMMGNFLMRLGQYARASQHTQEALTISVEIGDRHGMAEASWNLGSLLLNQGNFNEGGQHLKNAFQVYSEVGNELGAVRTSGWSLAIWDLYATGESASARARAEHLLAMVSHYGGPVATVPTSTLQWGIEISGVGLAHHTAWGLTALSIIALLEADYQRAIQLAREGLPLVGDGYFFHFLNRTVTEAAIAQGDYSGMHSAILARLAYGKTRPIVPEMMRDLVQLAAVAAAEGNQQQAVKWLGLAFTLPQSPKALLAKMPWITQLRARLEKELGADDYTTAWAEGSSRDYREVLAAIHLG